MQYKNFDNLVILGAGGYAREIFFHIQDLDLEKRIYFVDDVTPVKKIFGSKVIKNWKFPKDTKFVIGVGEPKIKEILVKKALSSGILPINTLVHPRALVQDAILGKGGIICPGATLTTNITLGDYITINNNSTIGHDTVIGDFCNISPGCNISGNNTIGNSCSLGAGTVTREKINICANVTTGLQSGVVKNITEAGTYIGIPTKKIK